ncbi:hypothetical protein [Streptomyces sp. B5E4]|uniref:hypothetical protein n=1 Tax=Streptomyces sp. B5E4 TaxID=3153568 RepID=UPI00325D0CFD
MSSCFGFVLVLGLAFAAGFGLGGGWGRGLAAVGLGIVLILLYRHRCLLGSVRVLRAHLRHYGGGADGLKVRWVRIEGVAGLDTGPDGPAPLIPAPGGPRRTRHRERGTLSV